MSSSGHVALLPHLLGWERPGKTFEVALHAGSAPALLLALRGERPRDLHLLALTLAPPALAGLAFERLVEDRLGGPGSVALAQIAAGGALLAAERRPERRRVPGAADHAAVGMAQAVALVPGVSRYGAALTAARLRGLSGDAAVALALWAALPVTAAAGALRGARILRDGVEPALRAPLAAGVAAALATSLAALPLARSTRWRGLAAYRIALGAAALVREVEKRRKLEGSRMAGSPGRS